MGTLQSQRHGVGRSISYGEDKGGLHRSWSESSSYYCNIVLEDGLPPESEQYVVITGGHCSRMDYLKIAHQLH